MVWYFTDTLQLKSRPKSSRPRRDETLTLRDRDFEQKFEINRDLNVPRPILLKPNVYKCFEFFKLNFGQ